jgi:hypothetical protein
MATKISPTELAIVTIAAGERFLLSDGSIVRGGYRDGNAIVLAYGDDVVLLRAKPAAVLATYDSSTAVAIAFRRRLAPRGVVAPGARP